MQGRLYENCHMTNDKRILRLLFIAGGTVVAICIIIGTKQVRAEEQAQSQAARQTNAEAINIFVTTNGYLCHPTNSWTEAMPQITLAPEEIVLPVKISTNEHCITEVFKLSDLKSDELRRFMMNHLDQQVGILVGSNFIVTLYTSPISNGEIVVDFPFSESDNARLLAGALGQK